MDIEKLKAEFEQSECFKRLEHVAQYTFFEFGAYIKRTDVPADIEKKCGKLITSLLFSWSAWKEAKAQAVPEGYILIPKKMPDEVNDHLWDFMTDNFVCTNDYGDSFMACDDFNLDKFYAELVKAQEPAND